MSNSAQFDIASVAVMRQYDETVAAYCSPFICGDTDLDNFFNHDALLYDNELLGRTYAWIDITCPNRILGMVTLANDSIKAGNITSANARNRLQRYIRNAKRGRSYPAVLIGRLGVSKDLQGKNVHFGSQILCFIKDWFRSKENKTGCRFVVVDAYNNDETKRFYEKNGFKPLYSDEKDEKLFFGIDLQEDLKTRFYYYDLKWK
jgi:GNAT superfamily N-acetyltransferase